MSFSARASTMRSRERTTRHEWVRDGRSALRAAESSDFDLIILDLGLPRLDGMDVLRGLRSAGNATPVLILSARDADARPRIDGLNAGADDYLVKPFDLEELLARIHAIERRRSGGSTNRLRLGELVLDLGSMSVAYGGAHVELQRREFMLLKKLIENPNQVFSRAQLEESIYGWEGDVGSNTIDVHVHHLRRKLYPGVIRTVRGFGYRIDPAVAQARRLGQPRPWSMLVHALDSGAPPHRDPRLRCSSFSAPRRGASYEVAKHESEELFGARLATSARVLEALVAPRRCSTPRSRHRSSSNCRGSWSKPARTDRRSAIRTRRRSHSRSGATTAPCSCARCPRPVEPFSPNVAGFSTQRVNGELCHVFVLQSGNTWIHVAEKDEVRDELLHDLGIAVMTPLIVGALLLLVLVNCSGRVWTRTAAPARRDHSRAANRSRSDRSS